jgi:hypothetical protein
MNAHSLFLGKDWKVMTAAIKRHCGVDDEWKWKMKRETASCLCPRCNSVC